MWPIRTVSIYCVKCNERMGSGEPKLKRDDGQYEHMRKCIRTTEQDREKERLAELEKVIEAARLGGNSDEL